MLKLLALAPVLLSAQSFETASVKPHEAGGPCQSMIEPMTGGGLRVDCVNVKLLIAYAYEVQNYQITGGPSWIDSDRWNIIAKAPSVDKALTYENMTDAQRKDSNELIRRRLQALLADQFHLAIRRESREQSVYALTVAKGGPKLKESEDQSKSGLIARGRGRLLSRGALLDQAVQLLAVDLGRPVVNQTGLTKHYDYEIHFNNEDVTVFTAIQELGLKLEATRAPVETLVIERAEKPSGN